MPTDTLSISVLTFAAVAILASIVALIRTPANQWFSSQPRTIEEALQALPASAQARVISGNRRKAVISTLPWLLLGLPLAYYALAMKFSSDGPCMTFFGMNAGFVGLMIMSYVVPGLFLVYSLLNLSVGIRVIRHDYFPPLDSAQFKDVIATKGIACKVRGYFLVLCPALALFIVYLGHDVYATMSDGRSMQEMVSIFVDNCRT